MGEVATTTNRKSVLVSMASRYGMEPKAFEQTVRNTVMPSNVQVTNEQFAAFLLVANEYKLNPITKEIYAFPSRGGGVQPIVSIDGWLNIINSHPQFDGMEFKDQLDDSGKNLLAVTCRIYRKDRKHPTEVTEYMSECRGTSEPWKKWPVRMLRHKATIQAARYAFGFSGIVDPDEAERIIEVTGEATVSPPKEPEYYPDEAFAQHFPKWEAAILSGRKTAEEIINTVRAKAPLTLEQITKIKKVEQAIPAEEVEEVEDVWAEDEVMQ